MRSSWRFPIIGIVIVGAAALLAPQLGLSSYGKTVPMFILFVLFVFALQLMEMIRSKYRK